MIIEMMDQLLITKLGITSLGTGYCDEIWACGNQWLILNKNDIINPSSTM